MSIEKYIIAIDHGTSGIKSALVSTRGKVLDWVYQKVNLILDDNNKDLAEQDPNEWWDGIISTLKKLIKKKLVDPNDIVGICNTSQWSGTVAIDSNGEHLMNCIIWMDSRGSKSLEKLYKTPFKIAGYPISTLCNSIKRTGGAPSLTGKDPISHIMFIQKEMPEIYEKTSVFLEPQDYINYKLTGKIAASYTSIHLHWVTDIRDIRNINYSDTLFKIYKIDKNKFPKKLLWSTDILGPIKEELALELGLKEDVKIVMGAPDLYAAAIGSGAVRDYEGHLCIGTSNWLVCHLNHKKTDMFHNMASTPSAIKNKYLLSNEQEIAGGALQFLRDNILYHKDELLFESIRNSVSNIYEQIHDELNYRTDINDKDKTDIEKYLNQFKNQLLEKKELHSLLDIFDEIIKIIEEEEAKGILNLTFIKDKLLHYGDRLRKSDPLDNIYDYFDTIIEKTPAGSNKLIFTPWLFGERAPIADHTIRGGIYNLSLTSTREHLIRAIYEGIAYNVRWLLIYVEKFIKKYVKKENPKLIKDKKIMPVLNIVGGGAQSDVWCQIFADVLNRRIRQVNNPIQANSRGAAFIGSVGLGYITWDEVADLTEIKKEYHPNPDNREIYDELFKEFTNIYKTNKKLYKRLNH
jgi:sugar (pentulose or hexulose) kinase